ncbi:hypothetical protein RUM43_004491 [Polyplax serrata]|uniref:Uncharacterized protein n=1 Tax=Polyplax serrata TaxID=468196 RepID=A0AAN8SAX8_POLSC
MVFERRMLMLRTVFVALFIAMWCIFLNTKYWFILNEGDGVYVPSTKKYFYTSHPGLWNYDNIDTDFGITAPALVIIGLIFSCYTFSNSRHKVKRTAGAGSTLTVIEVVVNSIEYEKKHMPFTYPPGATHRYGYSFVLAWLVFVCNLLSGCAFFIFSRKRKGQKAPNEEIAMADCPTIIGR